MPKRRVAKTIPPMKRFRAVEGMFAGYFYDDTYKANVHVIWSTAKPLQKQQVTGYISSVFGVEGVASPDTAAATAIELYNGSRDAYGHVIAIYTAWEMSPRCLGLLAHEVWHVADQVLRRCGIHVIPGNDNEAHAYLIESLTRRLLTIITGKA